MASLKSAIVPVGRQLAVLVSVLAVCQYADADSLRTEVSAASKDIKKFLDRDRKSIAVGAFTAYKSPPGEAKGRIKQDGGAGPNVARLLMEELNKIGVRVSAEAELTVEGDYIDVDDVETKLLAAKLEFRIFNRRKEKQLAFGREVFGDAALPLLFGLSPELPPGTDAKERDRRMRDALDNPKIHLEGTRLSAVPDSPYAIEVLVERGGEYRVRKPEVKDGFASVSIRRGEKYAVRLINNAAHEVAVTLAIDGINTFAFAEKHSQDIPPDSQVIVAPKRTVLIRGWYRTNETSEEFLVTDYAKSAAAELKQSGAKVGTVTACFSAAWAKNGKPPADEPKTPGANSRSPEAATGRGKRFEEKYIEVERNIGVVRAVISVRYNR